MAAHRTEGPCTRCGEMMLVCIPTESYVEQGVYELICKCGQNRRIVSQAFDVVEHGPECPENRVIARRVS